MEEVTNIIIEEKMVDEQMEFNVSLSIYDPKSKTYENHSFIANSKEDAEEKIEEIKKVVSEFNKEYTEKTINGGATPSEAEEGENVI